MTTGISFATVSIHVITAAIVADRYGNESLDWDTGAQFTFVSGCRVQPATGTEVLDRVTRRWLLFAPPDTALTSADRVQWDGVTYDVVGEVRRWASPTGALAHLEADLSRVEG